ncbi:MAG: MBOAT family protein [Bacteroidales bacterium]|nr:MBOAT family protein [Bacteroidales bacterium]
MLFNSTVFLGFFLIVLIAYFSFKKSYKIQNVLLLIASYVFYGYWDWRFLFLIAFSTLVDYFVGMALDKEDRESKRKLLLLFSVFVNLSLLGFFKYFNFFVDSFTDVLNMLGFQGNTVSLKIILPVGISFYTFQTMSYTIDIFRRKLKPTRNFIDFALFVSFFPQLVAGPIERAVNLLPQISKARNIKKEQIYAGIFLILWGYFKKVVIADNMGILADRIFNNYESFHGLDLYIGIIAFSIQIYGDFSGYSDIARGIAKVLGFDLMLNFRLPYFAVNPSDFWNRWHISLSSWLRDYLYISLGGNRKGKLKTYRNLGLTMLLGGLWHGASWNFVLWGAFHGLILIFYRFFGFVSLPESWRGMNFNSVIKRWGSMFLMLMLTLFGWLIFRVDSMDQFAYFIKYMYLKPSDLSYEFFKLLFWFTLPLAVMQIFQHIKKDLLIVLRLPFGIILILYSLMLIAIFVYGAQVASEFIYFQF